MFHYPSLGILIFSVAYVSLQPVQKRSFFGCRFAGLDCAGVPLTIRDELPSSHRDPQGEPVASRPAMHGTSRGKSMHGKSPGGTRHTDRRFLNSAGPDRFAGAIHEGVRQRLRFLENSCSVQTHCKRARCYRLSEDALKHVGVWLTSREFRRQQPQPGVNRFASVPYYSLLTFLNVR